jgi:predicted metalloprotease with PDZ domain
MDGLRATQDNIEKLLANHRDQQSVALHAFRRDELMTFHVPIMEAPLDTCYLQFREECDSDTQRLREAWFGKA